MQKSVVEMGSGNPEDDFLGGYQPPPEGALSEVGIGAVQGATADFAGGLVDLLPYANYLINRNPAVVDMMAPAMDEAVEKYGSKALGERFFPPVEEGLEGYRDLGRIGGGMAGAAEAITARGAKTVGDGISSFMKFLDRREAVTPEGITAALPDTSTTEMIGGLMGKDGPSKFSEARAARRTKSDQEIYDELAAYFDEAPLGGERDSFRYVVPGVEDSTLKFNLELDERGREVVSDNKVSSANDYLTVSDHPLYQNIFGLKPDVARARIAQTEGGDTFIDYETMNNLSEGTKDVARFPELSEILDYPELYEQYPQLAKMKVFRLVDAEDQGIQAAYVRDGFQNKPVLLIGDTVDASSLQSSILHEVQHAIQAIENNPGGAAFTNIYNRLDQAFPEVDERYKRKAALEYYRNSYGEVEARMVQQMFRDPGSKEVVPTELRREMVSDADVNVAESDAVDRFGGIQESRLTDLDTFTKYLGGETLPNNPNRVFFPDLEFSEVTLRDSDYVDGALDIELLRAGKKGRGHGTEMMNRITQLADDTGKTFTLTPTPYGDGGLNLEELVEFYQSKGFRYIDPDPDNPDLDRPMVRYPRKAEGGVMGMVDVARDMTRGPRGVESLVPVARNMNRSMLG